MILSGWKFKGIVKRLYLTVTDMHVESRKSTLIEITSMADVDTAIATATPTTRVGVIGVNTSACELKDGKLTCRRRDILELLMLMDGGVLQGGDCMCMMRELVRDIIVVPVEKQRLLDAVKANAQDTSSDGWVEDWTVKVWVRDNIYRIYVNDPDPTSDSYFCAELECDTLHVSGFTHNVGDEWVNCFNSWVAQARKNVDTHILIGRNLGFVPDWRILVRIADNKYWESYPLTIEYHRGNPDRHSVTPLSYKRLSLDRIRSLIGDHTDVTLCARGEVCTHRVLDLSILDWRATDDMIEVVLAYIKELQCEYSSHTCTHNAEDELRRSQDHGGAGTSTKNY